MSTTAANVAPEIVLQKGIITNTVPACIQQVGIDLRLKKDVHIEVGKSANVEVIEQFNMQNYFGLITIRSSLSRKGILLTSGVYDPGFHGLGGVSLYNLSSSPLILLAGTRIAQMVVFEAASSSYYTGHYNEATSIESKLNNQSI